MGNIINVIFKFEFAGNIKFDFSRFHHFGVIVQVKCTPWLEQQLFKLIIAPKDS